MRSEWDRATRRRELEAKPFDTSLAGDAGLDVTALPWGGTERVAIFLPLAPDPARDGIEAALRS